MGKCQMAKWAKPHKLANSQNSPMIIGFTRPATSVTSRLFFCSSAFVVRMSKKTVVLFAAVIAMIVVGAVGETYGNSTDWHKLVLVQGLVPLYGSVGVGVTLEAVDSSAISAKVTFASENIISPTIVAASGIYAPTSTSPSICAEQSVLAAYLMEHSVTAKVNLELIEQANGGTLPPNTITLCASFNGTKWSQSGVKGSVEVEANIVYSPFNHNTMWSGDPNLGSFYLPFL